MSKTYFPGESAVALSLLQTHHTSLKQFVKEKTSLFLQKHHHRRFTATLHQSSANVTKNDHKSKVNLAVIKMREKVACAYRQNARLQNNISVLHPSEVNRQTSHGINTPPQSACDMDSASDASEEVEIFFGQEQKI